MTDCPMCFNSSGYTIFNGRYGEGQKCSHCKGKGYISDFAFNKLKKKLDGWIKDKPK